jgi:hypothetical protein
MQFRTFTQKILHKIFPPNASPLSFLAFYREMIGQTAKILARRSITRAKFGQFRHSASMLRHFSSKNVPGKTVASIPLEATETELKGGVMDRMVLSAEVAVSKIFPAGFGWQTASTLAVDMGLEATDVGFFLMTGAGDMVGVTIGHTVYYALKSVVADKKVNVSAQAQTGFFLGSAAFFSGFAWQPAVNLLQGASLGFNSVALGTTAICGLAFYSGLRFFRTAYSPVLPAIEAPTYGNLKADAQLSLSIGGATGAFVGTDVAYMDGAGNWLRPIVGIEASASELQGSATAGASTALGFAAFQTAQNVAWPKGRNWTD